MLNATLNLMRTLAAAGGLALPLAAAAASDPAEAQPAGFDAHLRQHLREAQVRSQQPAWVNPWMPGAGASGQPTAGESADRRLQALVAGHTRALLDRGSWENPWMQGPSYAAGAPLRSVAVGSGLTTGGEPQAAATQVLAAR